MEINIRSDAFFKIPGHKGDRWGRSREAAARWAPGLALLLAFFCVNTSHKGILRVYSCFGL